MSRLLVRAAVTVMPVAHEVLNVLDVSGELGGLPTATLDRTCPTLGLGWLSGKGEEWARPEARSDTRTANLCQALSPLLGYAGTIY